VIFEKWPKNEKKKDLTKAIWKMPYKKCYNQSWPSHDTCSFWWNVHCV